MTGTHEPVVVTRNLTKRYGNILALDDLSITVGRGQILGFIGPNGAGKTTTIKILVGLIRPTSGSASVAGADCVREVRRVKRLVGYMPDTFGAYDNMRVREYLDFFGAAFGIRRAERVRRIGAVMDVAGCSDLKDRYVESLSHGMQQRVGIARTLLHDPQVLILDEPANGLDPQARIEMRELLLRLASLGKTLLVTSHILPELARICHQAAIITRGKLRAFGTLEEIVRDLHPLRTVEVLLAGPGQIDAAAAVLRREVEPGLSVHPSPAESTVHFQTGKGDAELARVLAALVAAGVAVTQFREVQSDLEEVFLTVARQADGREAPAETAGAEILH